MHDTAGMKSPAAHPARGIESGSAENKPLWYEDIKMPLSGWLFGCLYEAGWFKQAALFPLRMSEWIKAQSSALFTAAGLRSYWMSWTLSSLPFTNSLHWSQCCCERLLVMFKMLTLNVWQSKCYFSGEINIWTDMRKYFNIQKTKQLINLLHLQDHNKDGWKYILEKGEILYMLWWGKELLINRPALGPSHDCWRTMAY